MQIIDLHTHLGKWFFPIEKVNVDDFLRLMEKNEIELSVVSSIRAIAHDFREGNRELAQAIKHRQNLLGYLFLNPNYLEESFEEMDKYLSEEKFVGLGELYNEGYIGSQTLNCDGHKRILERLLEKFSQRLVLFHCWGKNGISRLLEVAREFPEINFIAGHMGNPDWEVAAESFGKLENVYLEICSSLPARRKIETVVETIGAERVVFGSDSSLINPAFIIGMVVDSEINERDKEKIFYLNAKRLLNL